MAEVTGEIRLDGGDPIHFRVPFEFTGMVDTISLGEEIGRMVAAAVEKFTHAAQ